VTCSGTVANGERGSAGAVGGRAPRGLPREPTDVMHRSQRAQRTDPQTRAGLGVRVQRGTVACRCGADDAARETSRAQARLTSFEFDLGMFKCIFQTKVHKEPITKVVDLATRYNFYKDCMVFFSTICAQFTCQDVDFLDASE
jgi:hypothetical protein